MDELTKAQEIHQILNVVSQMLDVPVQMVPPKEGDPVAPQYNVIGILSRLIALYAFIGMEVTPASILPSFNSICNNIMYWNRKYAPDPLPQAPTPPIGDPPNAPSQPQ